MATHELSSASLAKLTSFLFWSYLYLTTAEKHKNKEPEWCSRVVTLVHGTAAALLGFCECRVSLMSPWQLTKKVMPSQYGLMLWSWGYFAFDLLWCLVYWSESNLILAHHVCALVAITRYMQKPFTGCTFSCTIALMELTNPLLQTRWLLRYEGYGDTLVYFAVETAYLTLFIALRGVLGTYLIIFIFKHDFFDAEEKLLSLLFYVVSMLFIYDIMGYVVHKYNKEVIGLKRINLPSINFETEVERQQRNEAGTSKYSFYK